MMAKNEGLDALNKIRKQHGLKPCRANEKVDVAAGQHADWMAHHHMSHMEGFFGPGEGKRLKTAGFDWNAIAENVAEGQSDVTEACEAWMGDYGHRRNMLGDYEYASVQSAESASGTKYWIAEFASGE